MRAKKQKSIKPTGITGSVNGNRFNIPAGKTRAAFFTAIDRRTGKSPVLKIRVESGGEAGPLVKEGYYSGAKQPHPMIVAGPHNALSLDLTGPDITGLEWEVPLSVYYVAGRVSLPENGVAPAGGLRFSMELTGYRDKTRLRYYDFITLPEGKNSVTYKIDIAEADKGLEFYLYYYSPSAEKAGYEKVGYFSPSGTVKDSDKRGFIALDKKRKELIDLQVIPSVPR